MSCIFCNIRDNKEITKVYEDDFMFIIKDLYPQAKLHYLAIPKEHYKDITELNDINSQILGKCIQKIGKLQDELGLSEGFRIVSNKGKNGKQSVMHLHLHILGGEELRENFS